MDTSSSPALGFPGRGGDHEGPPTTLVAPAGTPPIPPAKVALLLKLGKFSKKADKAADAVVGKACSFSGDTHVLMADGTTKPISKIKAGDKVIATDPETGRTESKVVTHV